MPSDPATAARVEQEAQRDLEVADRLGAADVYVDGEKDTEWVHWVGSMYFKPYRFENRAGSYVLGLKTEPHAELGKHRHRGEVQAFSVKGEWGYHEYKWRGKPGDYIVEVPGTIHTLFMGENSEVIFTLMGSIEFFNDDNTLRETLDGFSFWRMYEDQCAKNGTKPNMDLWF